MYYKVILAFIFEHMDTVAAFYAAFISIHKRIKSIYIDTELVLPMYNAYPYFSLKNLGKKALYTAKYGSC